jgi:hypothetical protein
MLLLNQLATKILKTSTLTSDKFDLGMSVAFLIIYLQSYIGAIQVVDKRLSDLDWYILFTLIGIIGILWCYFKWDLKINSYPKFNPNKQQIAIKKIIVFLGVMAFSFCFGYNYIEHNVGGKEIDISLQLINVTTISGIIAFDRVINQFQILISPQA